jgi:HlyD family secretion protein
MSGLKRMWTERRALMVAAIVILAGAVSFAGVRMSGSRTNAASFKAPAGIPTALATKGDLVDTVELRGEIRAARAVSLKAPSNAGDILITKLAKNGSAVHKGDVVITFDTATLQTTLDQRRSDLKQAAAQVEDARAQQRLAEQQDQTDLLQAKYDVEKAKLEASKAEILSAIDGEEKKLAVADAEQHLKQIQTKLNSDKQGALASITSLEQKRTKAQRDVKLYEDRIAAMIVKAPVDGTMNIQPNWRAGGNFGNSAPEFKEGDRAWAGAEVAQLPDLSTLQLNARVDESDRGRIHTNDQLSSRVDAVPDREFSGHISAISALAKMDYSQGWPPQKNFEVSMLLDHPDPRLRPGMSASDRIVVNRIAGVISIPKAAVFPRNGRTVVYVTNGGKDGDKFAERIVSIGHRGGGQIEILSGLSAGERVALRDPSQAGK